MQSTVICEPNTDEWHKLRLTGIGASEAAAVVGLSRYSTAREVYELKRGNLQPFEGNEYTQRGQRMEQTVRDFFMEDTGLKVGVKSPGLMRHPEWPFMLATPDFPIYRGNKITSGLEVKTTENFQLMKELGDEGTDQIPDEWICQCQQQMAVMEVEVLHVAVLVGLRLRKYQVQRNEELIQTLADAEAELWDRIQLGEPPEPDFSHAKTLDMIRQLHGVDESKVVELSSVSTTDWESYEMIGAKIKDLEKSRRELQAKVIHEIGDAHIAHLAGGEREIVRSVIAGGPVAYERKPYVKMTCRKARNQ